jgi:membrane protease YdiL (CAAX protease family)
MHPNLSNEFTSVSHPSVRYIEVTNIFILTLLGVRLTYGGLAALAVQSNPAIVSILNILYFFTTYLVTAILIWRVRDKLDEYRISKAALILFLVSIPYQLFIALTNLVDLPIIPILPLLPITVWLVISLVKNKQVRLVNPLTLSRWLLIGIGVGAFFGIFAGLLITLQNNQMGNNDSIFTMILKPTIQISNAAVQEEPLFRGFLWVYLLQRGWKDHRIWLFQAFLFWIAHIYYLPSGEFYSLLIFPPLAGLFLGWIAWKAGDIAPSMLAHGFFNGIVQIVPGIVMR